MSYIDIYDAVRNHWEADTPRPSHPAGPSSFGDFTLKKGVLSVTIGGETKTVNLNPLIPSIPPDLHLKSAVPSADGEKIIYTIGEANNPTRDETIETSLKESVTKLISGQFIPYDDADIKRRLAALEAAPQTHGANSFKEFEARYVPSDEFGAVANNTFATVRFSKTFSKIPFVLVTFDILTSTPRVAYVGNVSKSTFGIASNYISDVKGVWYQAYVLE